MIKGGGNVVFTSSSDEDSSELELSESDWPPKNLDIFPLRASEIQPFIPVEGLSTRTGII